MREDPLPGGAAKEHARPDVGILGGGGADRKCGPTG